MRQDYIEPDYVNGVKGSDGEIVIRPLNEEEKDFLNSYYEEVIGANFLHDPELKRLNASLKPFKKRTELTPTEKREYKKLQKAYHKRANEVLLFPDHEDQKKLYGENNARNRCLFNRTKSIGILDELNDSTYDEFHKNLYNNPEVADKILLNTIEPAVKTILRKKKKKDD